MDSETTQPGNDEAAAPQDEDNSRFLDLWDVLERIVHEDDWPEGPIRYLEVNFFASGDATWRVKGVEQLESVGGYYTPES